MSTKLLIPVSVDAASNAITFVNGEVHYTADYATIIASAEGKPEERASTNRIDELIALKKAGFSAEEIIELKQSKLI